MAKSEFSAQRSLGFPFVGQGLGGDEAGKLPAE